MIRALVDSDAVESASALPRVRAIVQRARGISVAGATRCPKGRGPFLRTAALLDSRAQTPLIRPILGTLSLPETPSPWERASVQSWRTTVSSTCLLYTSDAADDLLCV